MIHNVRREAAINDQKTDLLCIAPQGRESPGPNHSMIFPITHTNILVDLRNFSEPENAMSHKGCLGAELEVRPVLPRQP